MTKKLSFFIWLFLSLSISNAYAGKAFQEGIDYHIISPPQSTSSGDKIEVNELFWYGCPHCHKFEPFLEKWKTTLKSDVQFSHMPAIFSDRWELLARAFYIADILGLQEKIHAPLFHALHVERKRLTRKEHVIKFFEKYGVSAEKFNKAYNSFAVESKINYARKMSRKYQITGTPSLVINGKYRVEPSKKIGFQKMLEITDFLIAKERNS